MQKLQHYVFQTRYTLVYKKSKMSIFMAKLEKTNSPALRIKDQKIINCLFMKVLFIKRISKVLD